MSDAADTSAEAVEVIATNLWSYARTNKGAAAMHVAAATLRALLAEREALREALRRVAETRWDQDAAGAALCMIQTDAATALKETQP
jgi:hypothetical protein